MTTIEILFSIISTALLLLCLGFYFNAYAFRELSQKRQERSEKEIARINQSEEEASNSARISDLKEVIRVMQRQAVKLREIVREKDRKIRLLKEELKKTKYL